MSAFSMPCMRARNVFLLILSEKLHKILKLIIPDTIAGNISVVTLRCSCSGIISDLIKVWAVIHENKKNTPPNISVRTAVFKCLLMFAQTFCWN